MTEQSDASQKPADDSNEPPKVRFENSFFAKLEDVCFRLSEQTGEPVMNIKFAKNEVSLPLPGIRKELKLAKDCADSQMLNLCAKSLKYVKGLRLGDTLPSEIFTREASWELSQRHMQIAYQRVTLQLVNWLTGGDQVITDPDALLQLADDPNIKKNVNTAFGEAAEKLGLGRDRKEEVVQHVMTLAHELAYIEALRENMRRIENMVEKLQAFRRLYGRERSVADIADQITKLCGQALKSFQESFLEVDAQTGEILAVLRNLNSQIAYIRDQRDELHARLMAWDDILTEWDKVQVKATPDTPEMLRRAYRFLAPRFMMVNEWVLMTKPKSAADAVSQLGPDGKPKKKTPVMRW